MMQPSNTFISIIYNKVNFSLKTFFKYFKHKKEYKKFIKQIKNGSPSFGVLWKMADFIKLAELIFCYDNSLKNTEFGLYSSKGYAPEENGFKIRTSECCIIIKLYSSLNKVVVSYERLIGDNLKSSFTFINDEWVEDPTVYDEMMLEQIIKIINKKILMLFIHCYELR